MRLMKSLAALLALACLFAPRLGLADQYPFHWVESATVSIATGNSSASAALLKVPSSQMQIRLYNSCATTVFIRLGQSTVTATAAADLPIAPGSVEVLTLHADPLNSTAYIAMISPSGTCTLYITTGEGI